MSFKFKVKEFILALFSFLVLDLIWLGFVMKEFNMRQLAQIGRIENGVFQLQVAPAIVTYLLMAWAVTEYVLPRLTRQDSLLKVFFSGAPLGLIIYGVFDMTNLAILNGYPLAFVGPDMAWGTFVFGLVTVTVEYLNRLKR